MTDDYTEDVQVDALADIPVDEGEVQQGLKDASMAAGWYTTDPEVATVTTGKSEKTSRPYARFFGRVVGPEDGRIGFGWSWQRENRMTPDGQDTGKPDGMYQNYITLVQLYQRAFEVKPQTVADVNKFVATTPLQVRIVKGRDGGNFVVALRLPPR